MAMALIAWLRAPAPMTWTSTLPTCRTTPASAPATELGLDREDTFRTSMAVPSFGGRSSGAVFCDDTPVSCQKQVVAVPFARILSQAYRRSALRPTLLCRHERRSSTGFTL